MRPTRKRKVKSLSVALVGIASLLVLLQMLAMIVYLLLTDDSFIPSKKLKNISDLTAPLVCLALFLCLWQSTQNELKESWKNSLVGETLKTATLLTITPIFFGFCMWHWFMAGPVSYALHNASTPTERVIKNRVAYADTLGSRGCRNRAVLSDDKFLWQRKVCGISTAAEKALRNGGNIFLEGSVSQYGMQVSRYIVEFDPDHR